MRSNSNNASKLDFSTRRANMSNLRRLKIAAVVLSMLTVAPASAQLDRARQSPTDSESRDLPSTMLCRGGSSSRAATMPWIKLTGPGGEPVHVNVEQITSVRSDAEIPEGRTQLDFTSGKFQRVQENVEQVMQLIAGAAGARENDQAIAAALICVGSMARTSTWAA
jgi:hypothetical protein